MVERKGGKHYERATPRGEAKRVKSTVVKFQKLSWGGGAGKEGTRKEKGVSGCK